MRNTGLIILFAVLGFGPAEGQVPDGPIFREISVEPVGRIALDQPLAQRDRVAVRVRDGLYRLPAGFGDTKAIFIGVDSLYRVTNMIFVYIDGKDFDAARDEYIATLGVPVGSVEADSGGAEIQRVRWQDSTTSFELVRRQHPDSMPEVYSVLRNR